MKENKDINKNFISIFFKIYFDSNSVLGTNKILKIPDRESEGLKAF